MDRVERGQEFDVEPGDYRLVRRTAPSNEGVVDWLLDCPRKDFLVPIVHITESAIWLPVVDSKHD